MRPSPLRLAVAAVVSTVAACTLNTAGLGSADSRVAIVLPDGGAAGAGGAAGTLVGDDPSGGRSGENGGDAGSSGDGGDAAAGAGVAAGGSAGSDVAGATGAAGAGVAGAGAAGAGVAGAGAAGAGVAGGSAGAAGQGAAGNAPDAGAAGTGGTHPISAIGCADGAREGFTSLAQYPNIAACGGGWQIPGFVGPATMSPACERHGGDDGARPNGEGCSVADLCADGWHVCEGSVEFAMKAVDCRDALPTQGEGPAFYGTRQRGPDKTCDPTNQTGTNNVYGCGNFGSPAMAACLPFTRMLRDADCKANTPWMCVDGPIDYNVSELLDVTKPGPARGGVLCCR